MEININFNEEKTQQKHACYAAVNEFAHKKFAYRLLKRVACCCFGLSTLALTGTAILLYTILVLHLPGVGLFLLGFMASMVVLGIFGVLALCQLNTLKSQSAGELLQAHACKALLSQQMRQGGQDYEPIMSMQKSNKHQRSNNFGQYNTGNDNYE